MVSSLDPNTQANYTQIKSTHISLDWTLDFSSETISGTAIHDLVVVSEDQPPKEVVFDTQDLEVKAARIAGEDAKFTFGKFHPVMGTPLSIELPNSQELKPGSKVQVLIEYSTSKKSIALQWLDKEQTQGKRFPFLFSQCQPTYARTLLPVQDSPSVKITYSASVTSTLPVLLSAIRQSPPSDGPPHDGKTIGKDKVVYKYNQPVPIPSYLLAIAAGDLRYKGFDKIPGKEWSTGIWAEPESIDAAYWEFSADTARFLATEETIVTPYKFGVYDVLILPPSFPYGGMENPCISFLTPSLLTGDRSQVDVVVHELTHSWFGNGVTHAHASHFWLNEGWTTYIERVLQQKLHGPAERGFSYLIGYEALKEALKEYESKPRYQQLVIEFEKGEDPDDAYSSIPYEKGSNFILYLETLLGGLDVFLPYVGDYVNTYIGKSITTEQWKSHLYSYWTKYDKENGTSKVKALDSVDWDAWFSGRGLELPHKNTYDTSLAEKSFALAARWDESRNKKVEELDFDEEKDMGDWTNGNQVVVLLEKLSTYPFLPSSHLFHLAGVYKKRIAKTANSEIRLRFYKLLLRDPESEVAKAIAKSAVGWVVGEESDAPSSATLEASKGSKGVIKGRMKYCRPVFRDVGKVDLELARKVWGENKQGFHPIARKLIEKDLGLA